MKTLYLVGESSPISDATGIQPPACGTLTALVPLDPRHGVFPNLVMTPLLATMSAFQIAGEVPSELWKHVNRLLEDNSEYRFNLFDKLKGSKSADDRFTMREEAVAKWSSFDSKNDLWLIFGYQTAFGLLRWLLKGQERATRQQIKTFGTEFLSLASKRWAPDTGLPATPPKDKCAQEGYLHRLCTNEDVDGQGVCQMLRHAIQHWQPQLADEVLIRLRSVVPLLHNEAYQLAPYGIGQVCFLLCGPWGANVKSPQELYWRFIGGSVKRRLVSQ